MRYKKKQYFESINLIKTKCRTHKSKILIKNCGLFNLKLKFGTLRLFY